MYRILSYSAIAAIASLCLIACNRYDNAKEKPQSSIARSADESAANTESTADSASNSYAIMDTSVNQNPTQTQNPTAPTSIGNPHAQSAQSPSPYEPENLPRKRIRSADIKCRVDNVLQATLNLERLVTTLDGGITESHIDNAPIETKELAYKDDSLKKIQVIAPTATLTLRIPEKHLDSVVNQLSRSSAYISFRILKQNDVTLKYLSNNLKNTELAKSRIDIDKGEKNRLDLLQFKDQRQEKLVDRKIENLQLNDDVKYSTLTVCFFQPPITDITIQINPQAITQTSFSTDLLSSLHMSVEIIRFITLVIIGAWPIWLIVILGWFAFRKWNLQRQPRS